ncbi:MAG: hypothetical protein WC451_05630 [Patescibacteria group bacterium]
MKQLRVVMLLITAFAVLVVFQAATAPVQAGGFALDSIFAQVYSAKVTVVDAGVTAYATYHKDFGDQVVTAVAPNSGNVTMLWDKYGITAPTRWLRIVTVVKDVKGNQVVDLKQAFVTPANERSNMGIVCKVVNPYEIWIDGESLPDFVRFTPVVVQNASKKERTIIWIFHVVNHFERENTTDVFITRLDVSDELSLDLVVDQPQLGLTQGMLEAEDRPDTLTRFFRSYLYGRYPLQLIKTIAPYQIKADGRAQRVQGDLEAGFRDQIAKLQAAYDEKLGVYQDKIDELIAKLNAAQEASKPRNWTLRAGASPTGSWAVWVSQNGRSVGPLCVKDEKIVVNGDPGTYFVEVVPWGQKFESWHRYDVTSRGQQLEVN